MTSPTEHLLNAFENGDREAAVEFVQPYTDVIQAAVADPGSSMEVRLKAYCVLTWYGNPDAAVDAVMKAFASQSESDRLRVTKMLKGSQFAPTPKERAALETILATDPSAVVKAEAQRCLGK
jgi:hypothetical protein